MAEAEGELASGSWDLPTYDSHAEALQQALQDDMQDLELFAEMCSPPPFNASGMHAQAAAGSCMGGAQVLAPHASQPCRLRSMQLGPLPQPQAGGRSLGP